MCANSGNTFHRITNNSHTIFSIARPAQEKDIGAVADAYLFNNLFKGFWSASQVQFLDRFKSYGSAKREFTLHFRASNKYP